MEKFKSILTLLINSSKVKEELKTNELTQLIHSNDIGEFSLTLKFKEVEREAIINELNKDKTIPIIPLIVADNLHCENGPAVFITINGKIDDNYTIFGLNGNLYYAKVNETEKDVMDEYLSDLKTIKEETKND